MKKSLNISTKHIQMKKASSTVFISIAVASVLVSFCIVFLNILWNTSKYNTRVHDAQEMVRDTFENNLSAVPELQSSFKNLEIGANLIADQPEDKTNSEVVLDALPSKFDYPALVSSIDNLAKTTAVKLASFQGVDLGESAEQSSTDPAPVEIPVILEVEGSYEAIKIFLKGVEDSIRPFEVTRIELTGTDDALRVLVNMNTYYQPAFNLNLETRIIE